MLETLALRRIAEALFGALLCASVAAQVDEYGRTPPDAYYGNLMGGLRVCELKYQVAVLKQQNGSEVTAEENPHKCVDTLVDSGSAELAKLMKTQRKPEAKTRLKDFHALWVATARSIDPTDGETQRAYQSRRAAAAQRLTEAWERFKLDSM